MSRHGLQVGVFCGKRRVGQVRKYKWIKGGWSRDRAEGAGADEDR